MHKVTRARNCIVLIWTLALFHGATSHCAESPIDMNPKAKGDAGVNRRVATPDGDYVGCTVTFTVNNLTFSPYDFSVPIDPASGNLISPVYVTNSQNQTTQRSSFDADGNITVYHQNNPWPGAWNANCFESKPTFYLGSTNVNANNEDSYTVDAGYEYDWTYAAGWELFIGSTTPGGSQNETSPRMFDGTNLVALRRRDMTHWVDNWDFTGKSPNPVTTVSLGYSSDVGNAGKFENITLAYRVWQDGSLSLDVSGDTINDISGQEVVYNPAVPNPTRFYWSNATIVDYKTFKGTVNQPLPPNEFVVLSAAQANKAFGLPLAGIPHGLLPNHDNWYVAYPGEIFPNQIMATGGRVQMANHRPTTMSVKRVIGVTQAGGSMGDTRSALDGGDFSCQVTAAKVSTISGNTVTANDWTSQFVDLGTEGSVGADIFADASVASSDTTQWYPSPVQPHTGSTQPADNNIPLPPFAKDARWLLEGTNRYYREEYESPNSVDILKITQGKGQSVVYCGDNNAPDYTNETVSISLHRATRLMGSRFPTANILPRTK